MEDMLDQDTQPEETQSPKPESKTESSFHALILTKGLDLLLDPISNLIEDDYLGTENLTRIWAEVTGQPPRPEEIATLKARINTVLDISQTVGGGVIAKDSAGKIARLFVSSTGAALAGNPLFRPLERGAYKGAQKVREVIDTKLVKSDH